jgi:hypothetical protein
MAFIDEEKQRSIMKHLLMAAATVVLFTGCVSNSRNAGRPGDGSHPDAADYQRVRDTDESNKSGTQKSSNNLREGFNH